MKNYNYRRHLTNRFGGQEVNVNYADKSVTAGIANHVTISVQNKSETHALPFAIIPANFDTQLLTPIVDIEEEQFDILSRECNVQEMNAAGYPIGGVAFDGEFEDEAKNISYACSSADPSQTIKNFLRYLKLNPTKLASIEVVSSNSNAFDTNMQLTYVNPFFKNAMQNIDLSTFYSLYQYAEDRIRIDFNDDNVELNDLSLLMANIPAATTMKFILRFK